MAASGGCKELTGTQSLPAGTPNPSSFNTPAGALGMRNATDSLFEQAMLQYTIDTGLLTDELEDVYTGTSSGVLTPGGVVTDPLDERILPQLLTSGSDASGGSRSYAYLQTVRGAANQAIGALATYDSVASPALRGEMYAMQGYAEIMLAELFCSGVPLSTLDFEGDFTYHAGSTTQQVYQDAIAKLDTALILSGDSARIQNLARVGLGRAYLALGQYTQAVQVVDSVPDGFQYQVAVQWFEPLPNTLNYNATISDREGGNGIPFISSGDPRTADTNSAVNSVGAQLYFPKKYEATLFGQYAPITVADWIEARLIRAEAALETGDPSTWLTQLNYLRQNATVSGQTQTPLSQLSDPMTDTARVSLLFQERAYWLYLTGHRQGDLRRLVREYHRDQSQVYPTGDYFAPGQAVYGSDVTAPIPSSEDPNPLFHGCIDRHA